MTLLKKIEKIFSTFGDVYSVKVRRKPVDDFGVDASWALVTMTTPEDADKALSAQVLAPDGVTILPVARYNPKQAAASAGAARDEFLAHPARQDLVSAAQLKSSTNDSEFDLESAWDEIEKVSTGHGIREDSVNFAALEKWWKSKTAMDDPTAPVLPESMANGIAQKVEAERQWDRAQSYAVKDICQQVEAHNNTPNQHKEERSEAWSTLAKKLRALVRMRGFWGDLHEIYNTRDSSMYNSKSLPPWVRDPDSQFATVWDLVSVLMIVYITITVPLRSCMGRVLRDGEDATGVLEQRATFGTLGFYVDLFVDVFFIADIILNFRTAFYTADGFREGRPKAIAANYLRSWFVVDLLSCLPLGYLEYTAYSDSNDQNTHLIKTLRLMKMSKMLRVVRIRKIVMRYGQHPNALQSIRVTLLIFVIVMMTHLL
eukprot:COSAG02_NODE_1039_length_15040_cov_70.746737_10_plen_428_part_01